MAGQYNPEIHRRRSIRLKGYEYNRSGAYFVTICTKNRECLFGEIKNGKMKLNDAGKMVMYWWEKMNDKFPTIKTDEYVVMPNHFHGIIVIVGAAPCGRPADSASNFGQPHGVAPTLGNTMNWFKTMTTNDYINGIKQNNWPSINGKLWQRNYYEHIIRTDDELH